MGFHAYIGGSVLNVLEELKENLDTLETATRDYARQVFYSKEIQDFIVQANVRLLNEGRRPDLSEIEKEPIDNQKSNLYERYTIYKRSKEGMQTAFVDLKKTGFFYQSLEVRAGTDSLYEFSTDPIAPYLERTWGKILGLSDTDLFELRSRIIPKIVTFVNNKLKVKS